MSIEERILIVASGMSWTDSRKLHAIALEVRKREDRIKQLEDRIKRLEEAGDAMASWAKASPDCHYLFHSDERSLRVNNWIKAREAKP